MSEIYNGRKECGISQPNYLIDMASSPSLDSGSEGRRLLENGRDLSGYFTRTFRIRDSTAGGSVDTTA